METRRGAGGGFNFTNWLRTGRMIWTGAPCGTLEVKFNPNHDPKNGRFTFKDGGSPSKALQRSARDRNANRGEGSWGGGGFTGGGGGGSSGGGGATGDGYWLNDAEIRAFRARHPALEAYMASPGETLAKSQAETTRRPIDSESSMACHRAR